MSVGCITLGVMHRLAVLAASMLSAAVEYC